MARHLLIDASQIRQTGGHSSTGAPIWELVKVTTSSILEVVLLSSVGYLLARRGIIDKQTQTKINKINVSFFTPALLFSKVAFSLSPHRLAELLIVPLGFVICTLTSAAVAYLLSAVCRLSKAQRNFSIACAISPNSNSLPVALMQSLVVTVPQLHWEEEGEPEDTVDGMLGRALTYLVLYSTLGMFVRWSIGASLLSTVEDSPESESLHGQHRNNRPPAAYQDEPREERAGTARLVDYEDQSSPPRISVEEPSSDLRAPPEPLTDAGRPPVRRSSTQRSGVPAWARSFPNTPEGPSPPDSEDGHRDAALLSNQRFGRESVKKVFDTVVLLPLTAVYGFMTAPLWAATLSLVVALIHPLQVFLDSLEPVVGALQTSGACSIPLTMVVLGAYFVEERQAVQNDFSAQNEHGGTTAESRDPMMQSDTQRLDHNSKGRREDMGVPAVEPNDGPRSSLPWMSNPWKGSSDANLDGGPSSSQTGTRTAQERHSASATDLDASQSFEGHSSPAVDRAWPMSALQIRAQSARSSDERMEMRKRTMEMRTIFVSIASRMVITPLLLIPPMAWYAIATRYNVMDDPVFIAAACLIVGSPPALTLAQITSQKANGNPGFERLISKTIFVSYAILAAPTTILLVLSALLIAENDH